jgi:hypothetical protein
MLARLITALSLLAGCDSFFDLTIEPDGGSAEACPGGYTTQIGSKQYRFVTQAKYWIDAKVDCENDSSSAITHLPVFDDPAELALVHAAVPMAAPWTIHIGYARDVNITPPAYRAVTGAPLLDDSTMWDDQVDGGDQTVVDMAAHTMLWDTVPRLAPFPYFCQCDGVVAMETFNLQ